MKIRSTAGVRVLLTGVAGSALMWGAAHAQEAPAESTLGEVIVTAQKRGERLIDVPVPVTAMESSTLVQQNLVRLQDYASRIPGLAVAGREIRQISLRGVNTGGATNPAVAVTIDDVPVGPSTRMVSVFPDIDPSELSRVEVLRGPQGTLYGAASLGGLIKLVTKDPNPTQVSGRVELGYNEVDGGDDGWAGRVSLNVPLWQDKLALRVSGFRRDDAPFIDSINPLINGKDVNKVRTEGSRVALYFKPIDALTINVSRLEQTIALRNAAPTEVSPFPTDYRPVRGYFVSNVGPSITNTEFELTSLRADYDFGPATLTALSGWSKFGNFADSDVTSTFPFVFRPVAGPPILPNAPAGSSVRIKDGGSLDKFTQELRLASNGEGRLQWLLGAFYTKEDGLVLQNLQAFDPAGGLLAELARIPIPIDFQEKAVFADVTYRFSDRFDVQVGGRYSKNKQKFRQDAAINPLAVRFFGPSATGAGRNSSDDAFTWLVTPRFKLNDDTMVYARVATGYRPGGPNLVVPGADPTYGSDTVTNYEVGLKGHLLDRTVTFDASVFDIEWKDIQLQNTSPGNLAFLTNGGKARSRGIEAATQWSPGNGWVINANATFTDAELTETLPLPASGSGLLGTKGTQLPYTPKFASNLGLEKSFDVFDDFRLTLAANWSHVGRRNSQLRSSVAPAARRGALAMPAYDIVDLRATLSDGDWDFTVFARNLGSERGVLNVDDRQGAVPTTNATFTTPQTVGVSLARNF